MDPKKKTKTTTTTRRRKSDQPDARSGQETPRVRLVKQKRKKEPERIDVADDLRAARDHWMRKEARKARKADPLLRELQGRGDAREDPPDARPMPLADSPLTNPDQDGTQRMVASAVDLMDVKALQEMRPEVYGKLTPNQVWVLVAAERKGQLQHDVDLRKATARLAELNAQFGTKYQPEDLPGILDALRKRRLATNFFLSLPPGGNRDGVVAGSSLLDRLIADDEGRFRNFWETGTSQASDESVTRGAVEERFGYAYSLKRTEGTPLKFQGGGEGKFATVPTGAPVDEHDTSDAAEYLRRLQAETPNFLTPGEMPKYAAAVGESQAFGVNGRYGSSVVYWKPDIDWRTTRTPGDSWSQEYLASAMSFVGADHPATLFAYTDPQVARLAAAEGTGFKRDGKLVDEIERTGANLNGYIEAQIHGDLSWKDVDKVVLNYGIYGGIKGDVVVTHDDAVNDAKKLARFARDNGYDFTVEIGRKHVG